MKKRSKRYKEIKKQSVRNTKLKINEAIDLDQAVKIIAGSARSMGIEVKE